MKTVKLKNGSEEVVTLVASVFMVLQNLLKEQFGWVRLYDLVMLCRDRDYSAITDKSMKALEDLVLVSNGQVHESIRNITLSSVADFDTENARLVHPVADEATP